jgi:hypothetical protein
MARNSKLQQHSIRIGIEQSQSSIETADEEMKATVLQAFGIGSGQSFSWLKLNTPTVAIIPIQIGARHDNCK